MRIVFFNTWHGQTGSKIVDWIKDESKKTDIFGFLEVDPNFESKLEEVLVDFKPIYFKGVRTHYLSGTIEGKSFFVRDGVEVVEAKKQALFHVRRNDAGGMLYLRLGVKGRFLNIVLVHGKARPGTKVDTPIRLKQSDIIINYLKDVDGPKIIGGDFNLLPDTKSIKKIENSGFKNLISEYRIKDTRGPINHQKFKDTPEGVQNFADYTFVSKDVKVTGFRVPRVAISDHLPMILDFEV